MCSFQWANLTHIFASNMKLTQTMQVKLGTRKTMNLNPIFRLCYRFVHYTDIISNTYQDWVCESNIDSQRTLSCRSCPLEAKPAIYHVRTPEDQATEPYLQGGELLCTYQDTISLTTFVPFVYLQPNMAIDTT